MFISDIHFLDWVPASVSSDFLCTTRKYQLPRLFMRSCSGALLILVLIIHHLISESIKVELITEIFIYIENITIVLKSGFINNV